MKLTQIRFFGLMALAGLALVALSHFMPESFAALAHALGFGAAGGVALANGGTLPELTAISKAIEDSNRAFEQFKQTNENKSATHGDKLAALERQFADVMEAQKAAQTLLENIEAKSRRGGAIGGAMRGAGMNDEATADHKAAFDLMMRKGTAFDLSLEQKALGITTNSGADGGYAVPKVIDADIESLVINISPIRAIASVRQVSTSDYHKLVNLRGTASGWVGEADSRPATGTPTLADVKPTFGELYANPQATQQMLDDVFFNAESWLADEVATEFARAEGAAFISGNGTNKPTGFLNGSVVSTADATRAFGALQYVASGAAGAFLTTSSTVNPSDPLFTLVSSMKAAYRAGSGWVMNKDTLFKVAAFKDNAGRYIFNPMMAPGVPANIMGYEITEAEDMPAIAANSLSIAFGNFKRGYLIVDRIGTRVIRDPFSNKPYISFYTTKRVGGIVVNSEAIKLLKMSAS
jgi:HK97 family phage major capsid protein